jgi:hypothetical protein
MSWSDASPLAGVKILDLCRVVSGPFATMQLGDLGADVVKIEQPARGDESRSYGPPFLGGESAYFLSVNRNKRSCAIDMKSEAGKELILRLASVPDVLIKNFRAGARSGLGSEMMSSPPSTIASDVPTFMCGPSGSLVMSMTPASPCTGRRLWTAGDREVGGDGLMEHGCQSTHRRLVDPVHTRGIGRPAGRIRLLEQR